MSNETKRIAEAILRPIVNNTDKSALRSSKYQNSICLHMLAGVLAMAGDGTPRKLTVCLTDSSATLELGHQLAKRHGTDKIRLSRQEFEDVIVDTFGRKLPMEPISPQGWQEFGKKLHAKQYPKTRHTVIPLTTGVGARNFRL